MPRPAFSALLLVVLAGFLTAQSDSKALSLFEQTFRARQPATVAARLAALEALAGQGGKPVAEALVDAWLHTDGELLALDQRRAEITEEIGRLIKGQETAPERLLPEPQMLRFRELNQLAVDLRAEADLLRGLQHQLGEAVAAIRDRDALRHCLKAVVGNKKVPLPLKLRAARAAGAGAADVMEDLATALQRTRDTEEQLVLLDGLALAGPTARLHADAVVALLGHKEEAVRERAALALAQIAVPNAIEPMIRLLQRSSGQTQLRIASALEVLTHQQFGVNLGAWLAWWQAEGPAYLTGDKPLGKGVPSHRQTTNKNYYFGIPQDSSNAILYVLDCSGSMDKPVDFKTPATVAGGGDGKTTRLEACKKELIQALGRLRPEQQFGVLYYNDMPFLWQPKMLPAARQNVEQAIAEVRKLQPSQCTNIHDSLEMAFTLVGRGSRDKWYGVELDTIFLLTDGAPTTPNGQPDSTEKILLGVQTWNPLQRVTIHCIGIGMGLNEPFLRQLARENGGEFKKF